ncbi:hypothetical protein BJX63DRAFT_441387 [Aspergillus granulosus]|uniref:F-box domain-containing protein n=1 Tax=Aspergillus granulosus TaxID=176169 RepID=A0ABR4GSW2_9EURO
MPLFFQSLPLEVLLNVIDSLASEHLPSLHTFSLANKLLIDIEHWDNTLQKRNAYPFVQQLSIDGLAPLAKYDNPDDTKDSNTPHRHQRSCPEKDQWTDIGRRYTDFTPRIKGIDMSEMEAWKPLADFARRLSGLKDLLWIALTYFPPCLLEVLHKDLPNCRLHLRASTLNDLHGIVNLPPGYEAHQYALATSPSLGTIAFRMGNVQNAAVYTERAITMMAAGLAPNLTQVYMQYNNPSPLVYNPSIEKPPREHLFTEVPSTPPPVRLLALHEPSSESLQKWDQCISFSNLHTFQLYVYSSFPNVAAYTFLSLKNLVLRFGECTDDQETLVNLDNGAALLLSQLPPLMSLFVSGHCSVRTLRAALERHGPTLRRFKLRFTHLARHHKRTDITAELINEIRTSCPRLRDLSLRIPRSEGNQDEVNLYKALNFPSLNHLTLELDCSPMNSDPEAALTNLAVDEPLVRSIFSTITDKATDTGHPSSKSLLESLRVEVFMDWSLESIDSIDLFYQIMKETIWEVFQAPDGIFVHKSLRDKRHSWRNEIKARRRINKWARKVPAEAAFRELWPSARKGLFWMDDWHSFPLQSE